MKNKKRTCQLSNCKSKRKWGEILYCTTCNCALGNYSVIRYDPRNNDPHCDKHGRALVRQLKRFSRSFQDLENAIRLYPGLCSFLSEKKVRLQIENQNY